MQRTNYETSKNKKVEEQKDEIIADMDKEEEKEEPKKVEKKKKIDNKSVYVSGEYIKTKWGWRWEGETDKDGYPIIRKETATATLEHVERESWYWIEDPKKDLKYKVWKITWKTPREDGTMREPIFGYKNDGKLQQVRFVQKPFDLARRLYETGHFYESKAQKDSD